LYLVRALGWPAEPILADRHYGPDTHSALLVWLDNQPRLLDPGYAIVRPLTLPTDQELIVQTAFNELLLRPRDGGAKVELHTRVRGQTTYRLTFKTRPVDAAEFLRAWDVSFDQDMLRYPVVSRIAGGRHLYLQKNHLFVRGPDGGERIELAADAIGAEISRAFGIEARIVTEALAHLRRKGEKHGATVGA
jgi:hypothetical protein